MDNLLYVLLGLVVGTVSGIIGIGGGIMLVPILVFFFKMSQHQAQGTTLAILVPPIGILAAWTYYKHGYVDIGITAYICIGFLFGGLIGANIANFLPDIALERIFGVALLVVAIKMIFFAQ